MRTRIKTTHFSFEKGGDHIGETIKEKSKEDVEGHWNQYVGVDGYQCNK